MPEWEEDVSEPNAWANVVRVSALVVGGERILG